MGNEIYKNIIERLDDSVVIKLTIKELKELTNYEKKDLNLDVN